MHIHYNYRYLALVHERIVWLVGCTTTYCETVGMAPGDSPSTFLQVDGWMYLQISIQGFSSSCTQKAQAI